MTTEKTGRKENPALFKPGQSGNPAGRPKGSRNKLGEEFISALANDFQEHGQKAIETVRKEDPSTYVRVVANLLPKEIEIKRPEDGLSDEELERIVGELRSRLGEARSGAGQTASAEPPRGVSAVH